MPVRPEQILTGQGARDTAKRLLEEALEGDPLNAGQIEADQSTGSWVEILLKQRVQVDYPVHERFSLDAVDVQNGDPDGDDTPLERYEAWYLQRTLGMIPDDLDTVRAIRDLTELNKKVDDTLARVNKIGEQADHIWCVIRGSRGGIDSATCTDEADRIDGDWRETGWSTHAMIDELGGHHLEFFTWFGKYSNICMFLNDDSALVNEKGLILGVLEWRKAAVAIGSAHQEIGVDDVGTDVKTWEETLEKAESELVEYPRYLLQNSQN